MSIQFSARLIAAAVSAFTFAISASAGSAHHGHRHWNKERSPLELSVLGTYATGLGAGAAEIVAYDRQSRRLFVSNALAASIDILDIRHPSSPQRVGTIDVSALGAPNSVAVERGL